MCCHLHGQQPLFCKGNETFGRQIISSISPIQIRMKAMCLTITSIHNLYQKVEITIRAEDVYDFTSSKITSDGPNMYLIISFFLWAAVEMELQNLGLSSPRLCFTWKLLCCTFQWSITLKCWIKKTLKVALLHQT